MGGRKAEVEQRLKEYCKTIEDSADASDSGHDHDHFYGEAERVEKEDEENKVNTRKRKLSKKESAIPNPERDTKRVKVDLESNLETTAESDDESDTKRVDDKIKIKKKVNVRNICPKCPEETTQGRTCDWCNVFDCKHTLESGAFCRGKCERYGCSECVGEGVLKQCTKMEDCTEMICSSCSLWCEGCWDYMGMRGVDDEDIIKAMKTGEFQRYIDAAKDFW